MGQIYQNMKNYFFLEFTSYETINAVSRVATDKDMQDILNTLVDKYSLLCDKMATQQNTL